MTVKGKGAASLKEIGDKATFTINLKNNGKTDISYNFNDFGGAYTKAVDEDKNVYDKHISGSTLKADAEEFDLKAGESKDVTVTLTLPNGFHKSQWAEGFVGFKSNTSDSQISQWRSLGSTGTGTVRRRFLMALATLANQFILMKVHMSRITGIF